MVLKVESLSINSGRSVIQKWKIYHSKVEGWSFKSGRLVIQKWKVGHKVEC